MINYEFNISSNFTDNKNFCESVVADLDPDQKNITGFCDSYGYEITISYSKFNLQFSFCFKKNHSTQGSAGFYFPEAIISCELEINVIGLNEKHKIKYGNAKFKRFGMKNSIKTLVPSPFYYKSNSEFDEHKIPTQLNFFTSHYIEYFSLRNGKLKCNIYTLPKDLALLRSGIEEFVEGWV